MEKQLVTGMQVPSVALRRDGKGSKKRPGLPKSRGGCVTCKLRRVKCGQEKPECLRCLRCGAECGGYLTKGPPHDTESRSHSLSRNPSSHHAGSQLEYQCHQFFIAEVVQGLSAFSPSDLWHRSILQLSEVEPCILDAIIAIGGICKINHGVPENLRHDARRHFRHEHQFAVQKYQTSLASMRGSIAKGTMNARTALIACLLTICFENAYGRNDLGLRNCITGANMAKNLSIPGLSKLLGQQISEHATFMACAVEDELVAVFSRLDINAMVLIDPRPGAYHRTAKDELDQTVRNMPVIFYNLKDAGTYGNVAMTQCWHFIKIIQGLDKPPPWLPRTEEEVPDRWTDEVETCMANFQHWFLAFEPLWLRLQSTIKTNLQEYLRATLLRLQAVSTLVSIRGCLYRQETEWDKNLLEFKEIVALAEIYLSSKPKQPYTAFEHETIVYLYYLLLKCRDGETRRNALRLMDEYPRREAFLDTKHIATVGRWIMNEEEQGIGGVPECDQIFEERRIRVFGLDFNPVNGGHRTHGVLTKNAELELRSVNWP
ncbi:hypothetical protein N431DRAFT_407154 [Stipitochalara longipes BDJ]|nr:hypothetical protein N431DRAFT_407154 [Stipitochalara longipes BDJ]